MNIRITKTNNGRLANQLWAYAGIYALSRSLSASCSSLPFCMYQSYFDIQTGTWWIDRVVANLPTPLQNIIIRAYDWYISKKHASTVIMDHNKEFFLPPTPATSTRERNLTQSLANVKTNNETLYFSGWLFRNPTGEVEYKQDVLKFFSPKQKYRDNIENFLSPLRQEGALVVGVHIRQGDYISWHGGTYYFSCDEVGRILKQFVDWYGTSDITFVLCSDGEIEETAFEGLSVVRGLGTEIEDLYTLASCDMIIGSNSTYGSWASYYGSIPFIQFSRAVIDWSTYEIVRPHDNSQ